MICNICFRSQKLSTMTCIEKIAYAVGNLCPDYNEKGEPTIWHQPRRSTYKCSNGHYTFIETYSNGEESITSKEEAEFKKELGSSYNISGQLQQLPIPEGGGHIKYENFNDRNE